MLDMSRFLYDFRSVGGLADVNGRRVAGFLLIGGGGAGDEIVGGVGANQAIAQPPKPAPVIRAP